MRLLLVLWRDAVSDHAGWKPLEKVTNQQTAVVRSVGWELKRNKRHLTLAAHICDDEDCDGDVTVPIGMIISETDLVPKKKT